MSTILFRAALPAHALTAGVRAASASHADAYIGTSLLPLTKLVTTERLADGTCTTVYRLSKKLKRDIQYTAG